MHSGRESIKPEVQEEEVLHFAIFVGQVQRAYAWGIRPGPREKSP